MYAHSIPGETGPFLRMQWCQQIWRFSPPSPHNRSSTGLRTTSTGFGRRAARSLPGQSVVWWISRAFRPIQSNRRLESVQTKGPVYGPNDLKDRLSKVVRNDVSPTPHRSWLLLHTCGRLVYAKRHFHDFLTGSRWPISTVVRKGGYPQKVTPACSTQRFLAGYKTVCTIHTHTRAVLWCSDVSVIKSRHFSTVPNPAVGRPSPKWNFNRQRRGEYVFIVVQKTRNVPTFEFMFFFRFFCYYYFRYIIFFFT